MSFYNSMMGVLMKASSSIKASKGLWVVHNSEIVCKDID